MAQEVNRSMSLSNPHPPFTDGIQKLMAGFGGVGLLMMLLASVGNLPSMGLSIGQLLTFSLVLISIGTIGYAWRAYLTKSAGIKNDGVWFSGLASRGVMGWTSGIVLTGFYVLLYWFPQYLGQGSDEVANSGLVAFFDPLSQLLKGQPASQWFVYGTLYTIAILIFGIKFIWKYRHNKYQVLRTISVMFFQLGFAYLIPEFMANMNVPYNDMKNMWPLNYYFFDDWNIKGFIASGGIGLFMLILGIAMIFVISPILTYKYGKRWYCSWVCGCGGLAETAGDPFRHLSDKSLKAWQIERWLIHLVLLFSIIMTVAVVYSLMHNNPETFWINKTTFMFIIALILLGGIVFSKVKP
ncbi:MAG: 4Fe-4S binding protein, partial [Bacteroidia bacterium]|nr:4Fe-4S binding protein [Bacteroidia bacterium]